MSQTEGKFRAKYIGAETTQDPEKRWFKLIFQLNAEWIDDEWMQLEEGLADLTFASKMYSLKKTVSEGKTLSGYAVTQKHFENSFGFTLADVKAAGGFDEKLKDIEKVLILEADDEKYHNVKWVNKMPGEGGGMKKKPGQIDISDLL